MAYDLVIKGGRVVDETGVYARDVGIRDGKIAAIADSLEGAGGPALDAAGKYLFPGGIDVHTHLELPAEGAVSSDDFATGTVAAACGGTTTIIDFVTQNRGESLDRAIENRHLQAGGKAVIDYGFHIAPAEIDERTLARIPGLIADGYSSFKLYMTYDCRVSDGGLLRALARARDYGGLICVHAENFYMIDYLVTAFQAAGKMGPRYHALSRPPLAEGEATGRAIKLARLTGAPIYIMHLTCRESLSEVAAARAEGCPVMAETCPQYLSLSQDKYEQPGFEAAKYVLSPPLRAGEDQAVLWDGLAQGQIQVVSTDHCPFNFEGQKDLGRDFFARIPNGMPGIEARLALLYSLGVVRGRLSLQRFVEITAGNPARIFGLYPEKGAIAIGSDADLVIFDADREVTLTRSMLHENVDYTPYEGITLRGFPTATIARGRLIASNGEFVGAAGGGSFLKRRHPLPV